jgi:ATP-dependent DNA helicase RecQ
LLDGFVKMLLRSYTGLFSQFVKINEKEIANRNNLPVEKVVQLLTRLNQLNIITYITQKSKPQLIYTEERIDSRDVYISKENYELRKKAAWERLKAVETYVKATNRCRSQYLLAYFGEQSPKRCGQCDYCIERNKAELSEIEFDNIVEIIKPLLKIKSLAIEEIVDAVPKISSEKVIRAVEWLLDNDKIKYTTNKKLFWAVV